MPINKKARRCPVCRMDSMVYWTREDAGGRVIRNRKCLSCGCRFSTIETYWRTIWPKPDEEDYERRNHDAAT